MKKVLVAGAALMLAGSMVSAAYAEVNLSGDARVRYVYKDKYDFGNTDKDASDRFDSRIRVKFDAKAKGGAFMKARLRFDDFTWDGQGWGAYKEAKNVWADYAYIGIPMGPVTFTGGRMPADFSKFFSWDNRPTRVKLDYKAGGFRLIGLIDVLDENVNSADDWKDNDFMAYGIVASVKIGEDWSVKAYGRYQDDQREWDSASVSFPLAYTDDGSGASELAGVPSLEVEYLVPGHRDRSGFLGSIHADGKVGDVVALEAELAMKESDVIGTQDNGIGGYVQAAFPMGAFTPAVNMGFTQDGYVADDDFGFIMVGAAEPITVIDVGGSTSQDWLWIGGVANYQVSEQFKLAGNLVYVSIDTNDNAGITDPRLANAWELSGSATYTISEGADFTWKIGYLQPDFDGRLDGVGVQDDGAFGTYGRFQIKF